MSRALFQRFSSEKTKMLLWSSHTLVGEIINRLIRSTMSDSAVIKITAMTEYEREMTENDRKLNLILYKMPGKISLRRHVRQEMNGKRQQAKRGS